MHASRVTAVRPSLFARSTRGTGEWHIYTAIFDQRRSEVYVDGYCEATGKNVGSNTLDGLSIGCDHNGIFFLHGALAELPYEPGLHGFGAMEPCGQW